MKMPLMTPRSSLWRERRIHSIGYIDTWHNQGICSSEMFCSVFCSGIIWYYMSCSGITLVLKKGKESLFSIFIFYIYKKDKESFFLYHILHLVQVGIRHSSFAFPTLDYPASKPHSCLKNPSIISLCGCKRLYLSQPPAMKTEIGT